MLAATGEVSSCSAAARTSEVTSLGCLEVDGGAGQHQEHADGAGLGERVHPGEHVVEADHADRGEQREQRPEQDQHLADHRPPALDEAGDHRRADEADERDDDEHRQERAAAGLHRVRGDRARADDEQAVQRVDPVGQRRPDEQPVAEQRAGDEQRRTRR